MEKDFELGESHGIIITKLDTLLENQMADRKNITANTKWRWAHSGLIAAGLALPFAAQAFL